MKVTGAHALVLRTGFSVETKFLEIPLGVPMINFDSNWLIRGACKIGRTFSLAGGWFKPRQSALAAPERVLAAVATITLPLALLCPFFMFQPSLGDALLDGLYDYAEPGSLDPRSYSVVGGIERLFRDGDFVVAIVLLLFSVLFPGIKLALLWGVLIQPSRAKARLVRGLETLGPWSMADVFVVSVSLLAFKAFPGGTIFAIQWGYYLFLCSVLAGLIATWLAKRQLEKCSSSIGADWVRPASLGEQTNGALRQALPQSQSIRTSAEAGFDGGAPAS